MSSEGGFLAACWGGLTPPTKSRTKARKSIRRAVLATEMLLQMHQTQGAPAIVTRLLRDYYEIITRLFRDYYEIITILRDYYEIISTLRDYYEIITRLLRDVPRRGHGVPFGLLDV